MEKNPQSKLIFLIGMPAAGKTYWGERIAKKYGLDFIDLDVFISGQEQASVQALFAMYGENGFREREQKYLKKLINTVSEKTVVACGGGTPCFGDNMQQLLNSGVVIYLDAEIKELLEHLKESDETRPLLNNRGDISVYLTDMLKKRAKFYEQAQYILHTKDISLTTFAKILENV